MPIIIETGANVAEANSYVSLINAKLIATNFFGVALVGTDPEIEAGLIKATAYIETFRERFQGHATNGTAQSLSWPRNLVFVESLLIDSETIPALLQRAQVAAASLFLADTDLLAAEDGRLMISDKVGPLETKWSEKSFATADGKIRYPAIEAYLKPLLVESVAGGLRTF